VDRDKLLQYALPGGAPLAALFAWEAVVRIYDIQPVILPSPSLIVATLIEDWRTLFGSLEVRLSKIPRMFAALLLISATGVAIFVTLSAFSHLLLHRWRDSARTRET
jgi:ABC-type nitrate/sulfonate/bicarbonate transport system permease component